MMLPKCLHAILVNRIVPMAVKTISEKEQLIKGDFGLSCTASPVQLVRFNINSWLLSIIFVLHFINNFVDILSHLLLRQHCWVDTVGFLEEVTLGLNIISIAVLLTVMDVSCHTKPLYAFSVQMNFCLSGEQDIDTLCFCFIYACKGLLDHQLPVIFSHFIMFIQQIYLV